MNEKTHINDGIAVKKAWKFSGKPGSLKEWARKTGNFTHWLNGKLKKNQPKRVHKPRITKSKATPEAKGGGKKGKNKAA